MKRIAAISLIAASLTACGAANDPAEYKQYAPGVDRSKCAPVDIYTMTGPNGSAVFKPGYWPNNTETCVYQGTHEQIADPYATGYLTRKEGQMIMRLGDKSDLESFDGRLIIGPFKPATADTHTELAGWQYKFWNEELALGRARPASVMGTVNKQRWHSAQICTQVLPKLTKRTDRMNAEQLTAYNKLYAECAYWLNIHTPNKADMTKMQALSGQFIRIMNLNQAEQ